MIDRARPGLVALYDIRPGNGAGPFLQPWSPHGAVKWMIHNVIRTVSRQMNVDNLVIINILIRGLSYGYSEVSLLSASVFITVKVTPVYAHQNKE